MKKLLLLVVTSVSLFGSADYRESLKSSLYEQFVSCIDENDPEEPDFYKNMFKEALEELYSEENNDLQLLEQPMHINLSGSSAYVLVSGSNIINATPVLLQAGHLGAQGKWGSVLLISRADKTGFRTTDCGRRNLV